MLKIFTALFLCFLGISGEYARRGFCERVESCFYARTYRQSMRAKGRHGKHGPAGAKEDQELSGVQGFPGSLEAVEYERINGANDWKSRQGK